MSEHLTTTTTATFEQDVIEASRAQPVLVDFWADWCGPCKMLAPVLERVAADYAGRARLVKVNTDVESGLAQAQGIRSLPTLRLFRHGRAVDEIIGLQPDSAIRAVIERYLERPSDKLRAEAAGFAAAGRAEEAAGLLRSVVQDEPDNHDARVELIDALAQAGQVEEATEQYQALPVQALDAPRLKAVEARLQLARALVGQPSRAELEERVVARPDDLAAAGALAAREFMAGQHEQALERWLDLMRRDRGFGDGLARRCLLAAFDLLAEDPERVQPYRRRMMALLH